MAATFPPSCTSALRSSSAPVSATLRVFSPTVAAFWCTSKKSLFGRSFLGMCTMMVAPIGGSLSYCCIKESIRIGLHSSHIHSAFPTQLVQSKQVCLVSTSAELIRLYANHFWYAQRWFLCRLCSPLHVDSQLFAPIFQVSTSMAITIPCFFGASLTW
jgi:hypothetical protein